MADPLHSTRQELRGRRRVAPKAEDTSDVTRFRGVAVGAAGAALFGVVGAVSLWGVDGIRSPGPLSRPHARADLECDSCHKKTPAAAACVGCHGPHASTRPAHRDLASKGLMPCSTCHRVHRDNPGVALLPDGAVVRYGSGAETRLEGVEVAFVPTKTATVPIIPAAVCGGCHDLSSKRDPIAACLVAAQDDLGGARPTVCFDEHRTVTSASAPKGVSKGQRGTGRDAAWEVAREVASVAPMSPRTAVGALGSLGWIGLGVFAGVGALVVTRVARRRRRRTEGEADRPSAVVRPSLTVRLPTVDTTTCIGCYACVDACPYDVLEVERYVAVVAKPDDCCGLTLCEQRCPNGSLVVTEGELVEDRPDVGENLESRDVPGLFLAGDLTGLPLIRNAINQGAHAVRAVAESQGKSKSKGDLDLVIVGAGPAGISAALEAKSAGLEYVVLEQGSVAESIRSFPRGKLVFDQPLGMPLVGDLWLEESTKEELLGKWLRVVRREKLDIREGLRVTTIDRPGHGRGAFTVRALDRDGDETETRARRVLLALGRRGSPRKLAVEIPEGFADHVHYALADARSFEGQRVVIVGLGDVAMETAIALAGQRGTDVTVVHRGRGFSRGKSRNIEQLRRLADDGRVELLFETEVSGVDDGRVRLTGPSGPSRRPADALFVMIGSIPPRDLLSQVGLGAKKRE